MAGSPVASSGGDTTTTAVGVDDVLRRATVGVGPGAVSDADPRTVLHRIVQAARELSEARYGAVSVVGPNGAMVDLIVDGLSDAEVERIGALPHGRGVLGTLIRNPRPLRIRRIDDHPDAAGFPEHHPRMTSFLGVPITFHDRVFGILYLTDKQTAPEFSESDERAVATLGSAAGVAIENARLFVLSQRRGRWLEASADITRMLLERADRDSALRAVAKRARELSGSATIGVLLAATEGADLVVQEVDGEAAEDLRGRVVASDAPGLARVLTDGLPTTVDAVSTVLGSLGAAGRLGSKPALLVPFRSRTQATGALLLVEPSPTPTREDEYLLQTFADQAAIALDLARARIDGETVVLLEERDRIARELHDVVIQRLFATGLMLQGAQRVTDEPEARERIETAVDELDLTIQDLRSAIFELHRHAPSSLRAELAQLVSDYTDVLGFPPRLSTRGPLDTAVGEQLRAHILAVVRETLSNVAKHAEATRVEVAVTVGDDVTIQVADDGGGIDPTATQSGLRNLRKRARSLGGMLRIDGGQPHGTIVTWRVPQRV